MRRFDVVGGRCFCLREASARSTVVYPQAWLGDALCSMVEAPDLAPLRTSFLELENPPLGHLLTGGPRVRIPFAPAESLSLASTFEGPEPRLSARVCAAGCLPVDASDFPIRSGGRNELDGLQGAAGLDNAFRDCLVRRLQQFLFRDKDRLLRGRVRKRDEGAQAATSWEGHLRQFPAVAGSAQWLLGNDQTLSPSPDTTSADARLWNVRR